MLTHVHHGRHGRRKRAEVVHHATKTTRRHLVTTPTKRQSELGSNSAEVPMIDRSRRVFTTQQLIKEARHNVGVKRMVLQVLKVESSGSISRF